MQTKLKRVGEFLFFSLPLFAEVVRKYIFPSNAVFAFSDTLIFIILIILIIKGGSQITAWILGALLFLFSWGTFTVLIGHQNLMLGLVGARSLLVPGFFLIVSIELTRKIGQLEVSKLLYRMASFWFAIIGIMGILQVILGGGHWLNYFPEALIFDERQGIGDYTVGATGLPGLFRPTSIFLHTGKFGQIAFLITTYRLYYETSIRKLDGRWIFHRLYDVIVLLVSGQRGAFWGFILAGIVILLIKKRKIMFLSIIALMFFLISVIWIYFWEKSDISITWIITMRVISIINEIPYRLRNNLLEPIQYTIDRFGLIGEGMGAFSLGSAYWGGIPLYYVIPVGTAENSWLRIIAEQGIIGFIIQLIFWVVLFLFTLVTAWKRHKTKLIHNWFHPNMDLLLFCPVVVLAVLFFWANTHDIIGNVTVMSIALGMFGPSFSISVRVKAEASKIPRLNKKNLSSYL